MSVWCGIGSYDDYSVPCSCNEAAFFSQALTGGGRDVPRTMATELVISPIHSGRSKTRNGSAATASPTFHSVMVCVSSYCAPTDWLMLV